MTPITIWKRFNDRRRAFELNHIEDGHAPIEQREPKARSEEQARSWKGALWVRFHGYLIDGKVAGTPGCQDSLSTLMRGVRR